MPTQQIKRISQLSRKKKKKKHDEIVFLGKTKSNNIEILISKALIDTCISHDEFLFINNMLREYNEMKEEIKKSWKLCRIYYLSAVGIDEKTYERNGIETIADDDVKLWLHKKQIKEGLDQKKCEKLQ